jgi:GrpB-like predicted nucleotidyltransferase (UPF0157 family)
MGIDMAEDPIIVELYDPRWPSHFAAEQARIRALLPPSAVIEHIGSTAVPGLAAKPVIDIMIGLKTLAEARPCVTALQQMGYEYVQKYESVMPERRYLKRLENGRRSHQIHMVEFGGAFWIRHVAFRDYLRTHPEEAREYGRLKQELAAKFTQDRDGYMDGKDAFVKALESRALAVLKSSR